MAKDIPDLPGTSASPEPRKPWKKRKEHSPEEPPLTPFIDIIFQVLIFFLLTMKFRQKEGHLLSMLPKTLGPANTEVHDVPNDVRLSLCADMNKRMDQHLGYKEMHQEFIRDQKKAGRAVGDVCEVFLEYHFGEARKVYRTGRYPTKWGHNRQVYEQISDRAKVLYDLALEHERPQDRSFVILDVDGNVPFEHAIGFFNALNKRRIAKIEWAMNPRFDRYYGPSGH